jgi:FtsP/CotA-like multicopper oxidase with cupredoxin domain
MTLDTRTGQDMDTSPRGRPGARGWRRRIGRFGWLPVASILAITATAPLPGIARAANAPENGLTTMCKTSGGTGDAHYVLTAHDGYIITPDLNSIYMWGYSAGSDAFQYPGPLLCVTEGDTVTVTLQNQLPVPTSFTVLGVTGMTFSGIDADGTPSGSPLSGPATPTANDLAAGNVVPSVGAGKEATYTFKASHAGTYLYESGTSPELQDQMGLIGALIVRPAGHPDYVYDPAETGWTPGAVNNPSDPGHPTVGAPAGSKLATGLSTQFDPDREFLHLLSEIDPDLHSCFEEARLGRSVTQTPPGDGGFASRCSPTSAPFTYDMTQYKARYWLINGRSFPDTVDANNAEHLPAQPFSALVHVTPRTAKDLAPAVIRYLNAGPVAYPFHPHAQHEQVVGVDGRPRVAANPDGTVSDLTDDHFGLTVVPGQTLETFFSWVDAVGWDPATRPISFGGTAQDFASAYAEAPGVIVPQQYDKVNGEFWSGTPYLGYQDQPKPGELQFNECGEYYDVAHSHALFQVTNFGAGVGGMLTMIRIDPVGGCPK